MTAFLQPHPRLEKLRVLVIDASDQAADLMRGIFTCLGFGHIEVACDGHESVHTMRTKPVNLIYTSSELRVRPRTHSSAANAADEDTSLESAINAATFIHRLRHSPRSPNPFTPVLLAINPGESTDAAYAAGVNAIITKPLDISQLCKVICKTIDDRRPFITAESYRGPCRRVFSSRPPIGMPERRLRAIRLIKR